MLFETKLSTRIGVRWSNWLGVICILFLSNYQSYSTEYGYGRQYEAHGCGLIEENCATDGRNDRNAKLHRGGIGGL